MELLIRRLEAGDAPLAAQWDAYVQAHAQGTFFHQSGWLRVMQEAFRHRPHFLVALQPRAEGGHGGDRADAAATERVVGVLPLAQVQSWLFGHSLTSLPFAVVGGVLADDAQVADALLAHASALARELGVQHLELRHTQAQRPEWPQQDLYVLFRREIFPTEEANLLAIPRKQRAMVRKGIKAGLVAEIDTDGAWGVDRFFDLYADNVHRHGTPALSRRYFRLLREVFGQQVEVLTVCDPQGQPLSSVLSFYFRDEVLPYYAGDRWEARQWAANDFKYWELMRRACARGLRTFDFGRSKRGTGSFDFKRNWGFEPQALHYEYDLCGRDAVPQNNPSNARYQLLIRTWRRMPLWLANTLGPHLVRALG